MPEGVNWRDEPASGIYLSVVGSGVGTEMEGVNWRDEPASTGATRNG